MGESEVPGLRVEEVDHRAVRLEQARRLLDRGDQLVMDLAVAAVGIRRVRRAAASASPRRRRAGRLAVAAARAVEATVGRSAAVRRRARRGLGGHGPRIRRAPRIDGHGRSPGRLRHPADGTGTDVGRGRRRRASAVRLHVGRPPSRCPGATGDDAARQPATPPVTNNSLEVNARCSLPEPRSARPTWPSAPSSWRLALATGLHPLDPGWAAVHPERARLCGRRRRHGHPARPRRPLPLGHPPRPDRLRGDHDPRLGHHGPVLLAPPTSPRPSRSP